MILSLSGAYATTLTGLIPMLLLSGIANRVVVLLLSSRTGLHSSGIFVMPSSSILQLLAGLLLEIVSVGFRSVSLGVRLLANVAAGHVLTDIVACAKFSVSSSPLISGMAVVPVLRDLGVLAYEIFVSVIQLAVFSALTAVYAEAL